MFNSWLTLRLSTLPNLLERKRIKVTYIISQANSITTDTHTRKEKVSISFSLISSSCRNKFNTFYIHIFYTTTFLHMTFHNFHQLKSSRMLLQIGFSDRIVLKRTLFLYVATCELVQDMLSHFQIAHASVHMIYHRVSVFQVYIFSKSFSLTRKCNSCFPPNTWHNEDEYINSQKQGWEICHCRHAGMP